MARLDRMPDDERNHLLSLPCPTFDTSPWVTGAPLKKRRIALISTAGLHLRGAQPFGLRAADYRIIPGDAASSELVMSHISTNFDRTGFYQDVNVVFPLGRLRELAEEGVIGSFADYHYSFMGATDPKKMEATARELSRIMNKEGVDAVLLVPV